MMVFYDSMGMKAILGMPGSDLPNSFSAPAPRIHVTREDQVLKIPDFCLAGESGKNMVNGVFSFL